MREETSPGHGGTMCERAEWLECHDAPYLRNGKWFVGTGETLRCNACGVCLVPDLEPLPNCPACEYEVEIVCGWYVMCTNIACRVAGPSSDAEGTKWRAMCARLKGVE